MILKIQLLGIILSSKYLVEVKDIESQQVLGEEVEMVVTVLLVMKVPIVLVIIIIIISQLMTPVEVVVIQDKVDGGFIDPIAIMLT